MLVEEGISNILILYLLQGLQGKNRIDSHCRSCRIQFSFLQVKVEAPRNPARSSTDPAKHDYH